MTFAQWVGQPLHMGSPLRTALQYSVWRSLQLPGVGASTDGQHEKTETHSQREKTQMSVGDSLSHSPFHKQMDLFPISSFDLSHVTCPGV